MVGDGWHHLSAMAAAALHDDTMAALAEPTDSEVDGGRSARAQIPGGGKGVTVVWYSLVEARAEDLLYQYYTIFPSRFTIPVHGI